MTTPVEKPAYLIAKEAYEAEGNLWFLKNEDPPPFKVMRDGKTMFSSRNWMEAYDFYKPAEDKACWEAVAHAVAEHLKKFP